MNKVIFVLLDACRYDTSTNFAGFFEHMVDQKKGAKYKVKGELPAISRSMYATLMTGLPTIKHGIYSNEITDLCKEDSIFSLCKKAGKTSAAAAYFWMSMLFNKEGFGVTKDRFQINDTQNSINHGIYYWQEHYPDSHLLMDGEFLRTTYNPDFLIIHSMNIDYMGHVHGGESREYIQTLSTTTEHVGQMIPRWIEGGYSVIVSADHGMDKLGIHGGPTPSQQDLPLYAFGPKFKPGRFEESFISQLSIAPTICDILGIEHGAGMINNNDIKVI